MELPEADFRHLRVMTDDTGIFQHAVYGTPDRECGYTTDDNARALAAMALWQEATGKDDEEMTGLMQRYLAFVRHAFNEKNGRFRNFMSYERKWLEESGSEDAHGRAMWALGTTVKRSKNEQVVNAAEELFGRTMTTTRTFKSPRGWAFAVLGIESCLERFGENDEARNIGKELAGRLLEQFKRNGSEDWPWCEEVVTYCNAALPQALVAAGRGLDKREMTEQGLRTLEWLLEVQTGEGGRLSIIGNEGWMRRGGRRAQFDQQPVEAMGLVEACAEACRATGKRRWAEEARRCWEWYMGRNDLGQAVYDASTGGCRDGIGPESLNPNCGGESMVGWLIALGTMKELGKEA